MRLLILLAWSAAAQTPSAEVGSKACAGCHAEIYRKYSATGMARSSGRTGAGGFKESFQHSSFQHGPSGAAYEVDERYRLFFARGEVKGTRALEWFVGSGNVGRSYLFSMEGFLFQAPVSYYSAVGKWDVSPGYANRTTIDLTRAVEPACLQCHASRLQPVAGTQNGFQAAPFLEEGISCERCHGPGSAHLTRSGRGPIVNPAKLDARRRDAVCAQCHLTGAARIARARRSPYRPGALLSDSLAVFVWSDSASQGLTATSHFEKFALSACRKASGDRMWCGSCHDPHEQPAVAQRPAHYRARCQQCHQTAPCKETREARDANGDDCAACHMPRGETAAGEHVVYTDHSIPRRPDRAPAARESGRTLVPFFAGAPDDRDLALGYAVVAPTEPAVRRQALTLLEAAAAAQPSDVPVLSQLAQFYDRMGQQEKAVALYRRILEADAGRTAAGVNLGTYLIQQGQREQAIALWERALRHNPALTGVRMNLAVAQFQSGDRTAAIASLNRALAFDPAHAAARKLLAEIQAAGAR